MRLTAWYLHNIDFREAPSSLTELDVIARKEELAHDALRRSAKWEHLLKGHAVDLPPGWVPLERLVRTRRGIATGANAFFLVSREDARRAGIRQEMLRPCIGRALDVRYFIFSERDFEELARAEGKTRLIDFSGDLTEPERKYVAAGELAGLQKRYLLANRTPWYSMEQRPVAPIWAAVFGRGDLKFVFNDAGVRSLTNFHCIYPVIPDTIFARALTYCLNSSAVRSRSKLHTRMYGGGLSKFEPNDLKAIPVPDLSKVRKETLSGLSDALGEIDQRLRRGQAHPPPQAAEELVVRAGEEAHNSAPNEPSLGPQ